MKLHYCFLERFNNYFNRKIIKYDTLLEYQNNSKSFFIPVDTHGAMMPFDFNPNDNVMTEIIANEVPFDPDYFLLLDDDSNIVQRWFVLEQKRNRQGQWLYQLRRDVVSDNLDSLYEAPIFVQKGMLPEDDPFIVNPEGVSLNQIKRKEIVLKDQSATAWIVGYIAKNAGGSDINIQVDDEAIPITDATSLEAIEDEIGIERGVLVQLVNMENEQATQGHITQYYLFQYFMRDLDEIGADDRFPYVYAITSFDENLNYYSYTGGTTGRTPYPLLCEIRADCPSIPALNNSFVSAIANNKTALKNALPSILNATYTITQSQYNNLKNYQGKLIRYNGKYYRLNLVDTAYQTTDSIYDVSSESFASLESVRTDYINGSPYLLETNSKVYRRIYSEGQGFYLQLQEAGVSDVVPRLETIISSGRVTTFDQEYDIFAIPLNVTIQNNNDSYQTIDKYARRIASAIALDADAKLYDLQLLPYCPIPDLLTVGGQEGVLDISNLTEHKNFDYITSNSSGSITAYFTDDDNEWTASFDGTNTNIEVIFYVDNPQEQTINVDSENITVGGSQIPSADITVTTSDDYIKLNFSVAGDVDVSEDVLEWSVSYHISGTLMQGILFYVYDSSFTFTIQKQITLNKSKKIVSNCYMWRLISPNYQGAFEFNLAKNGGTVEYFNVFCTYKPYTPLIKIAPNFNYLYGQEFQDNRGLICGGDFSLPRITSAWESYELQNKNYQNIFNRDIQHLDFMQSIEMRNQLISGAVGILGDTAKGATAGALAGGGWGALAGGLLGATASTVGYFVDVDTLARTQRENKQLAIDKFNYQLGNIKALPYTLTKVGAFDEISKIFPVIEEYSCSDKELEAFENKIRWESMTVMRIGTLKEFMNFNGEANYFKGELIRNDKIADDPHLLNAIYEELLKGVYI